ncbi:hypothetical protein BaRGS_00004260 [Batillaria attramentaria]|uniref:ZZ-type zinc finger-containing protein 3 n=1 Tax=Batillaria attramentaria TaxID=370345 RepID=A0ABD0LXK6_9CAEN
MEASLESVDETIGDPYCFESDHVALKGNPDYHALLRTICVLEAQRAKALEDLDLLHEAKEKILSDPVSYVDKLQRGADLGVKLPAPQKIVQLPVIDWEKYTSSVDFASLDESLMRLKSSLVGNPTTDSKTGILDAAGEAIVRGRMRDPNKSSTFNQLWTAEEQKRLEELLVRYPPEEIESRRWQKIATALGNRTPQQVASRVQKYFIKLAKAGLPVPGRVPNLSAHLRRGGHRHQRYNRMYYPSSTFMQAYEPPVYMNEDDDYFEGFPDSQAESYAPSEGLSSTQDNSDDEGVPENLQDTPEYRELMELKQLQKDHLQSLDPSLVQHIDFKCDKCGCEPIVGTRWHCVDCPQDASLDFCDSCADNLSTFETRLHNSSHRIRPVKRALKPSQKMQDQDYMRFMPGDYNYLDPNYMPAS